MKLRSEDIMKQLWRVGLQQASIIQKLWSICEEFMTPSEASLKASEGLYEAYEYHRS